MAVVNNVSAALRQRLMHDIAELQTKPYPNITLHIHDANMKEACLVLIVDGYGPMHLTIDFPDDYPLYAPAIRMDSDVKHPNIFGNYICASILNTQEGYTPAYTLKGIAIQLLSFFGSEKIEQVGGGRAYDLEKYRELHSHVRDSYTCTKCRYGMSTTAKIATRSEPLIPPPTTGLASEAHFPSLQETSPKRTAQRREYKEAFRARSLSNESLSSLSLSDSKLRFKKSIHERNIPDEVLLLICDHLDTEDLMMFAQAWGRIGRVMTGYDVIRTKELQCFCFKKDYMSTSLGVGVNTATRTRQKLLESEFDLLSREGFYDHRIRRSVHGAEFQHWLPLPISHAHWRKVEGEVSTALMDIGQAANLDTVYHPHQVLFAFMNDIVVKLNKETSEATRRSPIYPFEEIAKSTLTHASEKAIESYFHLFHLLICLATANHKIVEDANKTIKSFKDGRSSKKDCPNLGRLLVAALISEIEIDELIIKAIIKETITRNVVWMLDFRGAGMAELSYLEPSAVSEYRLRKTFEASKTSYRLLMFLSLFRRVAVGSPRKPLKKLRDEAFARHGAPPLGSAKGLAESIKKIHRVDKFPDFLSAMGIKNVPSKEFFTNFLRECVTDSVEKGYSRMPISQGEALFLRQVREPGVEVAGGLNLVRSKRPQSFFPERESQQARGGRGGRGGGRGGRGRGGWH
jgi:ubiquitin-protein ligase